MKILFLFWTFLTFFLYIGYACESCSDILNFEQTVNKSDLIIIGKKTAEAPTTGNEGPEWIEVEILQVLKGNPDKNQITVNSWDAMCPYGIVIDNQTYVILLQKREEYYDAVDFGCTEVDTFLVENNMVNFKGEKISIEEFGHELDLYSSRTVVEDKILKKQYLYYLIPLVLILAVMLVIIIVRKR